MNRSRKLLGWSLTLLLVSACGGPRNAVPRPDGAADGGPRNGAPSGTATGTAAAAELPAAGHPGWVGVVVTRDAVDVSTEVTGRIESVFVRVGDRVRQGDRLARLDTRNLAQDLAMAEASLRAARAEVNRSRSQQEEARTRYERRADLPDTFSREEIQASRMEMETARATLEAAEARASEQEVRVEQLESALGRAEIRAPFAGTVALRYLDAGATVLAGAPVVRLITSEELLVRFAVPPETAEEITMGQRVEVTVEDAGLVTPAVIHHIAPEIDTASQMVFVEARLEAPEVRPGRLRSGLVARVEPAGGPEAG